MAKKFTEEQYQKILDIGRENSDISISWIMGNPLYEYIESIDKEEELNIAGLFLIPESREWAHDKFVEKEKRYVWHSKDLNSVGEYRRLYTRSGEIQDYSVSSSATVSPDEKLTESQVLNSCYNSDRFSKREVQ